jgi:hypothetical protein
VLTAKNGETLTLDGYSDSSYSSAVPWSVLEGTGRFASASGNGTLSFNFDSNAMTATIALAGTLSRQTRPKGVVPRARGRPFPSRTPTSR